MPAPLETRRPYTMIELLGVIAIISILMAIGIGVMGYINRAGAEAQTKALVKLLEVANEAYKNKFGYYIPQRVSAPGVADAFYLDTGATPNTCFLQFIDYEEMKGSGQIKDHSGREYVVDAWGKHVRYRNPGVKNKMKFDLFSYGMDGSEGNDDDIKNW